MKLEISNIQKMASLSAAKSQIATELFRLLAINGIDPDDIDISNPFENSILASLKDDEKNPSKSIEVSRIEELCNAYAMLQGKIDSLS